MRNGERITINGQVYRLDAVLSSGAGSYGEVWAAVNAAGRAVAIKLINAEAMTQADPALHGHWRAHLEREITFLKGLNADQSRHVVTLLDHGEVDGQPALVLERLQTNLGQWLAQLRRESAPPDLAQVLDWAEQILEGLDVVHQAGFVYRDLKFSNLLVGADGARLKLADFGSLKREDGDNTRSFIGTPATMAPEQVLPARRGADGYEYAVDYRADYYALGLLLFALLTDPPTTAAQRRLGQLLALYGQEGAGQHEVALGGLDEEERVLLRRSIEFWTVPARPEQDCGTAVWLVQLIDRLLARDPADRPADSLEIRAALDRVRLAATATPTLTPDWNAPPPAAPPNRRLRRTGRPPLQFRRRWAVLAGAVGLASALAWAMIRPAREIGPDQADSLRAIITPTTADLAQPAKPITPAVEPDTPSAAPPVSPVAAPEPPVTADAPTAETPASADDAPVTEAPEPADDAPVAETPEPPAPPTASVAETPEPPAPPTASVAETPEPPAPPAVLAAEPRQPPKTPVPPARIAPAEPRPTAKPAPAAKPRAVVAAPRPAVTPVAVKPRPPVRAKPAASPAPAKITPAPAIAADRPAAVERSSASGRPAAVERPAVVERPPVAPAPVSRIAKPTSPPAAPAAPESPPRSSITVRVTPPPRENRPSKPATPAQPAASIASRPAAPPKPAVKPASPAARTEPPNRVASRPESPPVLPPIKLEGRPESPPVLPPIRLEARPQSAPPAPPPIELVSRSGVATPTSRAAPTVARAVPKPPPHSSAPPSAQPADPITRIRDDASRAATEFGNLVSRTSTTVSQEVKRGLEAADQTVGRWTGRCNPADGCQRAQVERRDRRSDRPAGQAAALPESPARYREDDGFAKPPPRPPRDDYR